MKNNIYILSVESSCDETSMAIVKNGHEIIAHTVLTQMDTHANYGGVVPEIASRMHTENITIVLEDLWSQTELTPNDIDAIAVTYAPGLMGSLLVGIECAKVLSLVYEKPLIKVHHTAGHIYANKIEDDLYFPLLALVVSGGHTDLIYMDSDYSFKVIGSTLDDAIGETYDKVARVLDLKYPGGPNVEKLALSGKNTYNLPKPMMDESYNFSFSGLKSAIINLVHNETQRGNNVSRENLANSFQTTAINEISRKVELAIKNINIQNMIIAGGVSANQYLRNEIKNICDKYNVKLSVPKLKYCTDNAAMIGCAAYPLYLKNDFSNLNLNAKSNDNLY